MRCPRILSIGRIRRASGFGRQLSGLFDSLAHCYEIHHVGTDAALDTPDRSPDGWTLHPAERDDSRGLEALRHLITRLAPDLVLITDDLWNVAPPLEIVASASRVPVVASCPVDGIVTDGRVLDFLPRVARFVTYTRHSRSSCLQALARSEGADAVGQAAGKMEMIPLGVDTARFRPLGSEAGQADRRREARRFLFPDDPALWEGYLVINANTNTYRKRPDLTLEAFAMFSRGMPSDVRLLMHMNWLGWGCDVAGLSESLGILDRVIWLDDRDRLPNLDVETLNLVYNAADCGVSTTMAEGWGYVPLEHAATLAPQVLPSFGGLAEIWTGAAALVDAVEDVSMPWLPLGYRKVRAGDVAATLRRLYALGEERVQVAERCRRVALDPSFQPAEVAARWSNLFDAVLSGGSET